MTAENEAREDPRYLAFGEFRVDTLWRKLYRGAEPVRVTGRIFDLLMAFLRHPGRSLSRSELLDEVWAGCFVEDANLTQSVFVLRRILGGEAGGQEYILTESGVGYRFIRRVEVLPDAAGAPPPGERLTLRSSPSRRGRLLAAASLLLAGIALAAYLFSSRTAPPADPRADRVAPAHVERELAGLGTASFRAYDQLVRGQYHLAARTGRGLTRARDAFAAALEEDPAFAQAWAGLAQAEFLLGLYWLDDFPTRERYRRSEDAARRALIADPALPEAHLVLGMLALHSRYDSAASARHFEKALALAPKLARAHHWYAFHLLSQGRYDEALDRLGRARELDPLSLIVRSAEAAFATYGGRYEEAVVLCDGILEVEEGFGRAHFNRGLALEQLGRTAEAEASFRRARQLLGATDEVTSALAHLAWTAGRTARGEELTAALRDASPYLLAVALAGQNETDAALQAMARAVERREVMVWTLELDPRFEGLRRHPDYPSLLEALHLPEGGAAIARGPLEAAPTGLARSLAQEECPPALSFRSSLSPLENC
jgi:DNA-binding winged helix-turn-helix (wHTH) protein/Tfp pilus assembly protein PilF